LTTEESYLIRGKCIITISIALMILSIGLFLLQNLSISKENYNISFEQINTKNMSTVNVAFKTGAESVLASKVKLKETPYKIEQTLVETKEPLQAVQLSNPVVKQQAWFMPTVQGTITSYPRYGHYALDITSPRGTAETIYPVADGTVAAIYYDNAGAKIVIINHIVDGQPYMSQYAHLSSFAPGLYVGKFLTVYDAIGQMGSTGISTGVHLHLAVASCNLYGPNCESLGHFFNFVRYQYNTGFYGLQSVRHVPYTWYNSR